MEVLVLFKTTEIPGHNYKRGGHHSPHGSIYASIPFRLCGQAVHALITFLCYDKQYMP